jgi:hypothetical protein
LLVATVAATVAPTHPIHNPPTSKFVLGTMALFAAMGARGAAQAARETSPATCDHFVVSFDDRVISLACPDGSTESARLDEIERISIEPYDNPYLDPWMGPFLVVLHERDRRLRIPAFSVGLNVFVERLRELPGIDRDGLDALLRGGEPSPCVLWTREKGVRHRRSGPRPGLVRELVPDSYSIATRIAWTWRPTACAIGLVGPCAYRHACAEAYHGGAALDGQ